MKVPGLPANELARLARLREYDILDTPPEEGFDDIVALAAQIFDAPIALVSLLDEERQWFKARVGLGALSTPRDISFCGHVVESGELMLVPDSWADERFTDNPLVQGGPHVRFYVGMPLTTDAGVLGTLCVIDQRPREVTQAQLDALARLSRQVLAQLGLRRQLQLRGIQLDLARSEQVALSSTRDALQSELSALEGLHEITCYSGSASDKMRAMLRLGLRTFGLRLGLLSRVEGDVYTVQEGVADHGAAPERGAQFPLGDTYCLHVLTTREPTGFHDAARQLQGHPCYEKFQLQSYVGAPVMVDGDPYGTLSFSGENARSQPFSTGELAMVRHFAQWAGSQLEEERRREELRFREHLELAERMYDESTSSFFERAPELLCVADAQGYFKQLNASWERTLGWTCSELKAQPLLDWVHPDDREHTSAISARLWQGEPIVGFENRYRTKGGAYRWLLWTARLDSDAGVIYASARDITERKDVERMKNEFVSTVSHELRTPMTSIRGSLGLVLGGVTGVVPDAARALIQIACDSTDRLVRLVNDMLDVDKIESGQMALRTVQTDLGKLVAAAIIANQSYADTHGVHFELEAVPSALVNVDPDRVAQVMDNLLSIAAKYAEGSGEVRVLVTVGEQGCRVEVKDRGPGISPQFTALVFTRFAQADSSAKRKAAGTGLGLNIAKSIVELHGGKMGFETQLGVGTTFFFELPAAEQRAPLVSATPPPLLLRHCLIVEDDADIARHLKRMLALRGLSCDVAHTIERARELMRVEQYDLITLDVNLPDGDGLKLASVDNRPPGNELTPVVVISVRAAGPSDLVVAALPIAEWLKKPVCERDLRRAIRSVFRQGGERLPRVLHVEDDGPLAQVTERVLADVAQVISATTLGEARAPGKGAF